MGNFLLLRSTLLLVLVASLAVAEEREVCEPNLDWPSQRTLILSEHPAQSAPELYVGGRISTVLRLEKPCDRDRTQMLGWEGHFEPLICAGPAVVLYPRRDLTPQDRFLLLVTLVDGTEIPFIVTAHQQTYYEREVDQQVNVFADREGYAAMLASLNRVLERERKLREENERYREEETSVDHAFATLLANGDVKQTPFRLERTTVLTDGDVDMKIEFFSGKGKAAAVVRLANTHLDEPWRLKDARLTSSLTGKSKPFALRMSRKEIISGASGKLAFVVDKSAFASEQGPVDLTLEITRSDGAPQAFVFLDHRLIRK